MTMYYQRPRLSLKELDEEGVQLDARLDTLIE
jgi:hypothetical protein